MPYNQIRRHVGGWTRRILISGMMGALLPTFFFAFLVQDRHAIWTFFLYSFFYSYVIGTMAYLIVPLCWLPWQRFGKPVLWTFRCLLLLAISVTGTLIVCAILLAIGMIRAAEFWAVYRGNVRIAALVTVVVGTMISVYEEMRSQLEQTTLQLRTRELERERALKLATEARLSSLESRMHPHFLFNTLNSISALIQEDPQRAERLLERMAALLRFSLDSEQARLVPLERELKIVTDYLEIERARFGERLRYTISVDGGLEQRMLPPLALQTLVENSVKHVVAPNRRGGNITIQAGAPHDVLEVTVTDSGSGFDLAAIPAGHGLDNLQGRLAAIFGTSATLTRGAQPGALVLRIP